MDNTTASHGMKVTIWNPSLPIKTFKFNFFNQYFIFLSKQMHQFSVISFLLLHHHFSFSLCSWKPVSGDVPGQCSPLFISGMAELLRAVLDLHLTLLQQSSCWFVCFSVSLYIEEMWSLIQSGFPSLDDEVRGKASPMVDISKCWWAHDWEVLVPALRFQVYVQSVRICRSVERLKSVYCWCNCYYWCSAALDIHCIAFKGSHSICWSLLVCYGGSDL